MSSADSEVRECEIHLHDEAQVCDSEPAAYEPLLLGKDALKHAKDAQDFLLVPLDCAGHFLRVGPDEPDRLAEIRAIRRFSGCNTVSLRRRCEDTYPCPDAWKKSHCSCCIFSSKPVAEILPSASYFSIRYVMIAFDSLERGERTFRGTVSETSKLQDPPDDKVVVLVVNQRRDASVRVELGMLRRSVLVLRKVDVNRVILEAELLEDDRDLPIGV